MPKHTMELAEHAVFEFCEAHDIDFGLVSDTGTVENLLDLGFTLPQIAGGHVGYDTMISNLYSLD